MRIVLRASWTAAAGLALLGLNACGGDDGEEKLPFGLTSEVVAPANHADEIVFAPDGRIFFAEKFTGDIRIIRADGTPQEEPFAHLDVLNWIELDWGLTGLALDPDFAQNHYVYAFYTRRASSEAPERAEPSPTAEEATERIHALAAPPRQETSTATPSPAPGGPPPLETAPGQQQPTEAPQDEDTPTQAPGPAAPTDQPPIGQPVLVRFTENNGKGEDLTIISEDFPTTDPGKAGYNANGSIHFGPDGMLYAAVGDYDFGASNGLVKNLGSPIGKLLRLDPVTGLGPPDNPFADTQEADPRVFAYGFREPFDFVFHPETEAIYGTDNTPYTCEELNIIRAGQDYGWPDVGEFPFSDCNAGPGVKAVHAFAREGKQPPEYLSLVEVTGLAFTPGSRYPALGDSLFACEGHRSLIGEVSPGVLRRLALTGESQVTSDDVIVRDCRGDAAVSDDGTLYYSNATEIRRLLPGDTGGAPPTQPAGSQ
jgi:glucose/arabinose dehydrogenase